MKTSPLGIILALLSTLFAAFGQLFFKLGAELNIKAILDTILNQNLILTLSTLYSNPILKLGTILFLGFVLYGFGAILLILALRKGELSVIYPIFAANYIWVAILSSYFLSEFISISNWLGIATIVLGISFIGYGSTLLGEDKTASLERFGVIEE
jgi:uncharacterized membrane protein